MPHVFNFLDCQLFWLIYRCHGYINGIGANVSWLLFLHELFIRSFILHSWASYQIRQIAGCACAGNAGNVFPRRRIQRKLRVSDPGMHYGTCVTHVPWCMSGSLYPQWWGKRSRHSRRMRIRNLTYLARGLCYDSKCIHVIHLSVVRITAVCWDIHALDTNEATMNDTNNSEWNQLLKK